MRLRLMAAKLLRFFVHSITELTLEHFLSWRFSQIRLPLGLGESCLIFFNDFSNNSFVIRNLFGDIIWSIFYTKYLFLWLKNKGGAVCWLKLLAKGKLAKWYFFGVFLIWVRRKNFLPWCITTAGGCGVSAHKLVTVCLIRENRKVVFHDLRKFWGYQFLQGDTW